MVLTVYQPAYEDLWFRQMMMSDEDTMSYNHAWGGTIPFPEEKWAAWYDRWIRNTEGKRFYRCLKNETDPFVGEIAYHFDDDFDGYLADVVYWQNTEAEVTERRRSRFFAPLPKKTVSTCFMTLSPLTIRQPACF